VHSATVNYDESKNFEMPRVGTVARDEKQKESVDKHCKRHQNHLKHPESPTIKKEAIPNNVPQNIFLDSPTRRINTRLSPNPSRYSPKQIDKYCPYPQQPEMVKMAVQMKAAYSNRLAKNIKNIRMKN